MLAKMLAELTEQHGILCAVCSVNTADIIKTALQTTGLLRFFEQHQLIIRDREDFERCRHLKSAVISDTILPVLPSTSEEDVIFVDDDPGHHQDMRLRLPRARTLLIPRVDAALSANSRRAGTGLAAAAPVPQGGMRQVHCDEVLAWARAGPGGDGASGTGPGASAAMPHVTVPPPAEAPLCEFEPKRLTGPLARRCLKCGGHQWDKEHVGVPRAHGASNPGQYAQHLDP